MKKLALVFLVVVTLVALRSAFVYKKELSIWKDEYSELKELHHGMLSQNISLYKAIHKHKEALPTEFLLEVFPRDSAEILKNAQEQIHKN
ncbi:MAG: hypothetical protein Q4F75_05425 [Pseudomonadota bacterium]|nr:hypothetical protein [Pseudomonadota bacterium]